MTPYEWHLCRNWIARYMRPSTMVCHMHTEHGLRKMMETDVHVKATASEFRALMRDAGYEPANYLSEAWEYRISPAPLRLRKNSTISGWGASAHDERLTRRA